MYTGKNAHGMVRRFSFRASWNYWGLDIVICGGGKFIELSRSLLGRAFGGGGGRFRLGRWCSRMFDQLSEWFWGREMSKVFEALGGGGGGG